MTINSIENRKVMPNDLREKIKEVLTTRERTYFKMMWPTSGVLYITSKPGIAKSAMMKNIADQLGYAYIDMRLSMKDETDVGLFPDKVEYEGKTYLDFVTPLWAYKANLVPTIIHFEELNRASKQVRDAVLQLLLERGIGSDFKFNDNVLMVASGNLGEEDNTDVEEFDGALNNRLIHFKHTLDVEEWLEGYAKNNVHECIYRFIKANGEYLYKDATQNNKAYATPRSWTFLSDYIVCNYGPDASIEEFIDELRLIAASYIGESANKFLKYLSDIVNISINDILDRFDEVWFQLKKCNRDVRSELLEALKLKSLELMTDAQRANATKFINMLGDDEKMSYFLAVLDEKSVPSDKVKDFMRQWGEFLKNTFDLNLSVNVGNISMFKK